MIVRMYRDSKAKRYEIPSYKTPGSSAVDLTYIGDYSVTLHPNDRVMLSTGIYIEIPKGYEAQVRPRSGLAYKNGITIINTPGTIDSDYRGEIKVLVINLDHNDQIIEPGTRIAQMVIVPVVQVEFDEVNNLLDLSNTERGDGGFGSTGTSESLHTQN